MLTASIRDSMLRFGIRNFPAIVIIFIAAFFPILLTTVTAVAKVDQTHIKVAKNFGIKQSHMLTKIVLPSAFPYIATGLHIAFLVVLFIFLCSRT